MKLKAFTLIEIIIIVAIVSLFFGASMAYYVRFTEQKKLESAVGKLDDVLHLMQNKAIAGDISVTCTDFSGYRILFSGNDQYAAYICCNDSCSTPTLIQSYTLESPLIFSDSSPIYFKKLTGNIGSSGDVTIDITNSTISKCSRIRIKTSGLMGLESCP